ncbi:hypothetical protein [Hymenobacter rubidus]|uniref:hypothetical protein n=1 Tax=Hymenobacter rubidus TaxID=1441626 RepID=UPI00191D1453|nr:hypothetical protein [Hymenobacter rubidus]
MALPYSPAQQQQFRLDFAPVVGRYHRRKRRARRFALTSGGLFLVLVFTGSWSAAWFDLLFVLLVPLVQATIVLTIWAIIPPKCPGCAVPLLKFGAYCPECGSAGLTKPGSQWTDEHPAHCAACGKDMLQRPPRPPGARGQSFPSRQYRIRACSSCGLYLTEEGL